MTIEGVQQDRLLIRFFRLDPTDSERDASFVLDISGQNYKGMSLIFHISLRPVLTFAVITASPHLSSMAILVNALNESRDIYTFIKDVRTAYKPLVSPFFSLSTWFTYAIFSLTLPHDQIFLNPTFLYTSSINWCIIIPNHPIDVIFRQAIMQMIFHSTFVTSTRIRLDELWWLFYIKTLNKRTRTSEA